MTSKQWQEIKNNPELYEERKRKRKLWFHKPEVAERRKAKLKEQYRKRKEENPEEHRRFRAIENKRRLKNNRYGGLTYKEWRLQNPELYELKKEKAKQRQKERRILGIPDPKRSERQRRYRLKKKYRNYDKVINTTTHENKVDAEVTDEFLKKVWNKGTSNKVIKETKQEISNIIKMYGGMNNVSNYWR